MRIEQNRMEELAVGIGRSLNKGVRRPDDI
jgi:hypothetical protein